MNRAQHKRLVVLGAAESGVGAALLGKQQGWEVFVSDFGNIKAPYKARLTDAQIDFEEGGHSPEKILHAQCIVKSPGISEKTPMMQQIRAAGIDVCSEIEFGYWYKGSAKIIAITGSNGKSTTTKLIYHILQTAGYDAALAGNIGHSFAGQIATRPCAWYVLEISSFQLDDIHTFRPDIALLLNITPDHLDRYDYKLENYVAAKFRITENQKPEDTLIINQDDPILTTYLDTHFIQAQKLFFTMNQEQINPNDGAYIKNKEIHIMHQEDDMQMSVDDLTIKGKHNQYNSMAAGVSARVAGIRKEKIREAFSTFEGLEHRLEYVASVRGVAFINDSKATNVNAVWFALESMKKPVILILGGQDKGNDYSEIGELVAEKVKAIICLGADNKPIHDYFDGKAPRIIDTATMNDAVHAAYSQSDKGDVVLLAPGCASFDLFKNYEDRGNQFKEIVKGL